MYIKVSARSKSFHIIRTWTRVGSAITLCGRSATGESSDTFGDEKTCETCWRAKAKTEGA